jgi:hypothetical protein
MDRLYTVLINKIVKLSLPEDLSQVCMVNNELWKLTKIDIKKRDIAAFNNNTYNRRFMIYDGNIGFPTRFYIYNPPYWKKENNRVKTSNKKLRKKYSQYNKILMMLYNTRYLKNIIQNIILLLRL